ncbi:putative translation initiation factor eIF-2B subunit gamma [Echinococcus granulosus]|nr:putative translation initiation factor eIF-2B subunit gamma [Echinococcus granulosus]CDS18865.1 DNA polymerase epsilon catalytic subunit [Echinococcus granulosus]
MQAVVLALHDSSYLRQLTASGVVGQLPLGTRGSLLSNLVGVFESAGIVDPIIICRSGHSKQIEKCLPKSHRCIIVEVSATLSIPECLYRIRDHFTSVPFAQYVFLTYADVAVTELDLRDLFLRMVRTKAEIVALASPYTADAKLLKMARGTHDILVLDARDESLVMYVPASEVKKQIRVPKSIMSSHSNLTCRADLHDAGMYLLSGYALRMLEYDKDDVGLRKSFFKHIVNVEQHKLFQFDTSSMTSQLPKSLHYSQEEMPQYAKVVISVLENAPVCRRLDSTLGYLDAVKMIREKYPPENTMVEKTASVANASGGGRQVGQIVDTMQCEGCNFANGVLIRSCIICASCTVGQSTRLFSSVLLSGVVVGSGCKITNCVIGEGVTIDDNCTLKDCTVAAHQRIPAKSVMQSENMGFSEIDFDNLTI